MIDPNSGHADRLRAIPLFAALSDDALQRVAASMAEVDVPAGHVLIQVGAAGSGLFIIEEGEVVVERPGRPSVELGPGQFVGEMALLTEEGTRHNRVRAKTAVKLLAMSRRDFGQVLDEEPAIAVAMLPVLATRLARSD
jgi:CRP-like cAMP-binding protein